MIPKDFGDVNWIAVNVCANVIASVSLYGKPGIFHVVNPEFRSWDVILDSIM